MAAADYEEAVWDRGPTTAMMVASSGCVHSSFVVVHSLAILALVLMSSERKGRVVPLSTER